MQEPGLYPLAPVKCVVRVGRKAGPLMLCGNDGLLIWLQLEHCRRKVPDRYLTSATGGPKATGLGRGGPPAVRCAVCMHLNVIRTMALASSSDSLYFDCLGPRVAPPGPLSLLTEYCSLQAQVLNERPATGSELQTSCCSPSHGQDSMPLAVVQAAAHCPHCESVTESLQPAVGPEQPRPASE